MMMKTYVTGEANDRRRHTAYRTVRQAHVQLRTARSDAAFTLMDLLIVLAILSIVGMLAIPQMNAMRTGDSLRSFAGEIVSALEYTSTLAVQHRRPFGLHFKSNNRLCYVFDTRYHGDSDDHPEEVPPVGPNGIVYDPLDKLPYEIEIAEGAARLGVSVTVNTGSDHLLFYPDGHCSDIDPTIEIISGAETLTIRVDGITGRVTIEGVPVF